MNWTLLAVLIGLSARLAAQPVPQIASLLQGVSPDSLRKTVAEIAGVAPVRLNGGLETIRSRQYNTPGNELAFQYLKDRLVRYGYTLDSQVFGAAGKNLIGILPGRDTAGFVLLGAHYDNIGFPAGQGADDNGSGVAAVLECARLCRRLFAGCTLAFAFWDEEERGSVGSAAYVQRLLGRSEPLIGFINVDMAGWDGNGDGIAEVHARTVGQSIAWAARASALNADYVIGLQLQTVVPGDAATDVGPFWQAAQTAIGIGEDYDGDPYPCKHSPDDTLENLNFTYLAKQTRLVLATGLSVARVQPTAVASVSAENGGYSAGPNPFRGMLVVRGPNAPQRPPAVVVADLVGQVRYRGVATGGLVSIDTREWPAGTYLLAVVADGTPVYTARTVHLTD